MVVAVAHRARRARCVLLAGLALLLGGCASGPLSAGRFQDHVDWLADDARGGRGTGTPGMVAAAEYVAGQFAAAGLMPAGDAGGWLQAFEVAGERQLAEGNRLVIAGRDLELGVDYRPFASAVAVGLTAPAAFVGYGIQDLEGPKATGWDDYAGISVEGRVVVALRGGPGGPDGSFMQGPSQHHAQLGAKINRAYREGAAGILIVNGSQGAGGEDELLAYQALTAGGQVASLPAVHLTHAAGAAALVGLGLELAASQAAIEAAGAPASHALVGEVALTIATERLAEASMNVLGRLPGSDPRRADEWVLVGAHLDHLGLGGDGSRGGAGSAGQIHNGADDNASGVAGLIGIAQALAADPPSRTVVFAAFGAEERGLLGSRHLVDHMPLPAEQLVAMVNMDMIGRCQERKVLVGGVGTATVFEPLLGRAMADMDVATVREGDEAAAEAVLVVSPSAGVTGNSDHAPFFERQVPVLSFFTGLHEDYHMPSDDAALIDARSGAAIARLAAACTRALADEVVRPAFQDPATHQPSADGATVQSFRGRAVTRGSVRFGSMPDYAYEGDDGVRISGTSKDTPAARCGLRAGDVIVALDGTAIRNVSDYMVLLYSHLPGETMVVSVRRGDAIVELEAVLDPPLGNF